MSTSLVVRVNLAERSYDVRIGHGLLGSLGENARGLFDAKKCAVVTDSNVGPLYAASAMDSLARAGLSPFLITVPAGESSKSVAVVEDVCRQMIRAGLDRKSLLIALGGGVIGDLAGFAASIFQRGIPFIQMPTTVLAQVDSSVGGKTGVNTPEGKNLLGTFSQPRLVIADIDTLRTLPPREYHEGFAEIIKHAAIRDAAMLETILALEKQPGNAAAHQARTVCIPVHMLNTIDKLLRAEKQLVQDLGRDPTPKEIADEIHLPVERIHNIMRRSQWIAFPDTKIRDRDGENLLREKLKDELDSLIERQRAALIARNIAIKARIVEADEHELTGQRALLNFGHTIGHAIEASVPYGELLHGEAISLGMVAAARLSTKLSGLPVADADRIIALLGRFQLPTVLPQHITSAAILEHMKHDKKFSAGNIRFVLLRALGDAFVSQEVTMAHIAEAIEDLREGRSPSPQPRWTP